MSDARATLDSGTVLWQPTVEQVHSTQMHAFMAAMADRHHFDPTWSDFHHWSVEHHDQFWPEMLRFAEIQPTRQVDAVLSGTGMLGTQWFPGMQLNYAAHLLRFDGTGVAMDAHDESGRRRQLTWSQLRNVVAKFAGALKAHGIKRGDRVVGFLPNIPEAVIAMLASASLGAVWSSCSPDFGIQGVLDRFGQITPRVLLTADGYFYNGKTIDSLGPVQEITSRIPSIEKTVVVPFMADVPDLKGLAGAVSWSEFLDGAGPQPQLQFESLPFDHPLFVMYSSGTTGVPKCIVHGHGGTLLQHMKEHMLHCDLRRDDSILYFTTCGWMMWNWVVSGLGVGAKLVLYEGSPAHPNLHCLWSMAAQSKVTVFGTSPKFLSACAKAGIHPGRDHDLSTIRCMLSTGAPLTVENFEWVYQEIKPNLQLSSICGGTDIISCFMLGNPMLAVRAGEIQSVGLGMDVQAFDAAGQPVLGEKGELVCCKPFPSQPIGFWNDEDGQRYSAAYFEHYPDVWRHGDFIEITASGGVIVYGRSDATLNPGGVRIGTAEIYRLVEALDVVEDSIVVGRPTEDDVDVCLFVVLRPGMKLDEDVAAQIKHTIAEGATKRHVPKHIQQVSAVPYTISGKKVELAVTQVLQGRTVDNRDALANPDVLEEFAQLSI